MVGTKDPWRLLGTTYLDWNGQDTAEVGVSIVDAGYRRPTDGQLIIDPNPTFITHRLTIGVPPVTVPEPATLLVVGLGILGLAAYKRGRLFA